MNIKMVESSQGFAVLEEEEASTFACFVEWAYKGYYKAPDPDIAQAPPVLVGMVEDEDSRFPSQEPDDDLAIVPDESNDININWAASSRNVKKKGKKQTSHWGDPVEAEIDMYPRPSYTKATLKEAFVQREKTAPRSFISIPPARRNQNPSEDYTEIFLCHARLYVFADLYDIKSLKLLALEELQATLAIFDLHTERTTDIVKLLRYVYGQRNASAEGEGIRTMLTQYVGYEMDMLIKEEAFRDLMIEDGGPLLGDFMGMVDKRIC